jgi:DHA2 family multidrug resistance protein-like MFS transporter
VALSIVAVLALIFGIKLIAQDGVSGLAVLSILLGLAVGLLFVRRQRTLADPLVDLGLFGAPAFSASLASYTLAAFVSFGSFIFIAQYLQLVLGLSPFVAGLWTIPSSAGFVVGSLLTPAIVRKVRPGFVMAGGLACAAVGFAPFTQINTASALAIIVIGSVIFSLALAPVFTLATDIIVSSAPPERAGAAAAISETGAELGGALGIAILGSIGIAIYRAGLAAGMPPGVAPDAADAARDSLGGALVVAQDLQAQLGMALLGAAREAFTAALQLTAWISAAIALAAAVLAAILLRGAQSGVEPVHVPPARVPALQKPAPKVATTDAAQ